MKDAGIRWLPVSETSLMLYLVDTIDVQLAPVIGAISRKIKAECPDVCEVIPSYTSILVETRSFGIALDGLGEKVLGLARQVMESHGDADSGKLIELPVYYHPEVGQDLDALAKCAAMSVEEVISIHSGRDYRVCAIGFAPGFAFLAEVDERIAVPRHASPRSRVPAGSVGIADSQTAVYPADTPGGWHLIGNCPVPLYDPQKQPSSPFEVGDRVRFLPIDRETFIERGGRV